MTPGRPRKYHSELERKTAKKEQARKWRLKHSRTQSLQSSDDGLRAVIQQYLATKQRRTRKPTALTNDQKRELAATLIEAAGAIVGKLQGQPYAGLDPGEAAKQLTIWLRNLPGDQWDNRLGQRKINYFSRHETRVGPG